MIESPGSQGSRVGTTVAHLGLHGLQCSLPKGLPHRVPPATSDTPPSFLTHSKGGGTPCAWRCFSWWENRGQRSSLDASVPSTSRADSLVSSEGKPHALMLPGRH